MSACPVCGVDAEIRSLLFDICRACSPWGETPAAAFDAAASVFLLGPFSIGVRETECGSRARAVEVFRWADDAFTSAMAKAANPVSALREARAEVVRRMLEAR